MSKKEDPGAELTQAIIQTPEDLVKWVGEHDISPEVMRELFPPESREVLVRPKESLRAIMYMADRAASPFHAADDVSPRLFAAVKKAMKSLTRKQRKALALTHLENATMRTQVDIAGELNIRTDSLYERLMGAYKKLAKQLAEFEPEGQNLRST